MWTSGFMGLWSGVWGFRVVHHALGDCGMLRKTTALVEERWMDKILHDPKDPKLWELWYIPYNGSCRILSINRRTQGGTLIYTTSQVEHFPARENGGFLAMVFGV